LKYQVASDYLGLALLIQIGILSKKANGNPMKKSDIGLVNSGRSYSMLNTLSNNGWLEKLIAKRGFTFKLSKKGEQILNDYFILIQGEIRSNRVKY
jgi:predicted transcriptional regulator